ncbi:MAG: hypothetical protein JNK58_00230 [Phycisphaerae bacterium]|nr:hypothetical protein [Phycisphaerae bacterium]
MLGLRNKLALQPFTRLQLNLKFVPGSRCTLRNRRHIGQASFRVRRR